MTHTQHLEVNRIFPIFREEFSHLPKTDHHPMTPRFKTLLILAGIICVPMAIALFSKDNTINVIATLVALGVLIGTSKSVWQSENHGKQVVRVLSITVASAAAMSVGIWQNLLIGFLSQRFPQYKNLLSNLNPIPWWGSLIFLAIVLFMVNYFMSKDNLSMRINDRTIEEDFPDLSKDEKLIKLRNSLEASIRDIDNKTNWSVQNYVSLDAEVEVITNNKRERRITDLLKAVTKSKENIFLVIGDPGSGKSVALRKLALDLLKNQGDKIYNIPLYINLKEWSIEEKWTEQNPPTVKQLYDFVYQKVCDVDVFVSGFFQANFRRLYDTGKLYFILDSFDEIASVLDENDNSWLIQELSSVIFKFLKGAEGKDSQGILSSRIFRKPTREFQTKTILEIRPFSEDKIVTALKRTNILTEETLRILFKERSELVPIARNPFTASLLAEYIETHQGILPQNQAELYVSYIDQTLEKCKDRIARKGIDKATIKRCSMLLAKEMFDNYGLEVPINALRAKYPHEPIEEVVDILKFARLGRLGTGDDTLFSFVHRRFTEYFYVQVMLEENKDLDLKAIPQDSNTRDALVLYCEIAPFEKAQEIANFCWNTVVSINNPTDLKSVHCLRFLNDAFKGRIECLEDFRDELGNYIKQQISSQNSVVLIKIAVESVGLLKPDTMENCLIKAFGINDTWISETALKSCRYITQMSESLKEKILYSIENMEDWLFWKNSKDNIFNLKLLNDSEIFISLYTKRKVLILQVFFIIALSLAFRINIILCFLYVVLILTITLNIMLSSRTIKKINTYGTINSINISMLFLVMVLFFFNLLYPIKYYKLEFPIFSKYTFKEIILGLGLILTPYMYTSPQYKKFYSYFSEILISMTSFKMIKKLFKVKINFRVIFFQFIFFTTLAVLMYIGTIIIPIKYTKYFPVLSLVVFTPTIKNICLDIKFWKKIIWKNLNERSYISKVFLSIKTDYFKNKVITYIENNVSKATGEWTDMEILRPDGNRFKTRLAKMEEKWLGLNK
jgi:NACHT domain